MTVKRKPVKPLTPAERMWRRAWAARSLAEETLHQFIQQAWVVIEPEHPFVDNWHIQAMCQHLEAVSNGQISQLLANVPPGTMKSLLVSVFWFCWDWIKSPQHRFMYASYAAELSVRDSRKCRNLICSDWFQRNWGAEAVDTWGEDIVGTKFQAIELREDQNRQDRFENTAGGWRYSTSTGGGGTGEHPDYIVFDDPHKVKEAESDAERKAVIDWWDGTMSTRGIARGVRRVGIMQRVHAGDLAGHLLAKGTWEHICLPMRYEEPEQVTVNGTTVEVPRMKKTSLGFQDPRVKPGELLWPNLYPESKVANLEVELGLYHCNPAEAPVLMGDLSLRPIGSIAMGDEVVGFTQKKAIEGYNPKYLRQQLVRSKVLEVHKRIAWTVEMELDSGARIRCTPSHKWYRKQRNDWKGGSHYCPAQIGSPLVRVCPAWLPELTTEEQRMAGWLGGFFDGEGSISACKARSDFGYSSSSITFYQGSGRNLPLCDKLEAVLGHFGFQFGMTEKIRDDRTDKSNIPNYRMRSYRLRPNGLPLYQKFLHVAQPVKWRQRLIDAAFGCQFGTKERVVRFGRLIEEEVYALKTETGNYVVWGLCSSNSAGQLQQRPTPRGGGKFKRHWFEVVSAIPPCHRFVRYWDKACLVASTQIATSKGPRFINQVKSGDLVWTRFGLRKVMAAWETKRVNKLVSVLFSDGRCITGTADHLVLVRDVYWVGLATIMGGDYVREWPIGETQSWNELNLTESVIRERRERGTSLLTDRTRLKNGIGMIPCIGQCGALPTVIYPVVMMCTTRTITGITTRTTILNAFRMGRIWDGIALRSVVRQGFVRTWRESVLKHFRHISDISKHQEGNGKRVNGDSQRQQDDGIPVYDLTVEGAHEFIANGILVHNSTKGGTGARSSGVLMGEWFDDTAGLPAMRNKYVVADVINVREEAAEREAIIKQTAATDKVRFGYVETWVEQEPGSGGKESAQATVGNLAGFTCNFERVTGSKEVRADPFASQASVGKVKLLAAKWNSEYLEELEQFPLGRLKDEVDASSGAFNKLCAATGAFATAEGSYTGSAGEDLSTGGGMFVPDRLGSGDF
jgi:predicted phage terminase large subunit-like protein